MERATPNFPTEAAQIAELPRDVLTEIIARVGSNSLLDLSNTKLSCSKFKEVGQEKEVFERVALDTWRMDKFTERPDQMSPSEAIFMKRCRDVGNPQLLHWEALIGFVKHRSAVDSAQKLREACAKDRTGGGQYLRYVEIVVLLFSEEEEMRMSGVTLLKQMKNSGFFDKGLQRCREQLKTELYDLSWFLESDVQVVIGPVICRNREVHRSKRVISYCIGEQSDDCSECDADREIEFVLNCC